MCHVVCHGWCCLSIYVLLRLCSRLGYWSCDLLSEEFEEGSVRGRELTVTDAFLDPVEDVFILSL